MYGNNPFTFHIHTFLIFGLSKASYCTNSKCAAYLIHHSFIIERLIATKCKL